MGTGDRVHEAAHGDGTVYSIWRDMAFVLFDDGYECAYPLGDAHRWLTSVTPPLFEAVA